MMADASISEDGEAGEGYRRRTRRSWPLAEKLAILEDLAASGDPLAEVARRHGMNANHLLTWRRRAKAGTLDRRRGRPPGLSSDLGFRGQLIQSVGAASQVWSLAHDKLSNLTAVIGPAPAAGTAGAQRVTGYDPLNRATSQNRGVSGRSNRRRVINVA